jgi:N-acetylglutamate synthase-like GNAT family acetyltransferase
MKNLKPDIYIKPFQQSDIPELIKILELNNQYDFPSIEGPDSMKRVASCKAAIFLVARINDRLCGFIKGIYDGSRALIHLLSVHPEMQNTGIGTMLVDSFRTECKKRGAPTLSVSVTTSSEIFWEKQGFRTIPVFLMLQEKI